MEVVIGKYQSWLVQQKQNYRASQIKAAIAVNSEMLQFYWQLGSDIVGMEADQQWGSKFISRLSEDLRREIPNAKCFSATNLEYVRRFFKLYAHVSFLPQVGGKSETSARAIPPQVGGEMVQGVSKQLYFEDFGTRFPNVLRLILSVPWGHHKVLIDKFWGKRDVALFYVQRIVENGWSRSMLEHWIDTNLHLREGRAVTNFSSVPEIAADSDLANELLKDPYDFSFLSLTERYREQELKDALIGNIEKYMLELGQGFCFKGREIDMDMGDEVRPMDMLFYNDVKRCYLVIEVKVRKFRPADVGQINAYMSAVNRRFRKDGDGPTIGLIICKEKDRITAQYALEDVNKPIGIADYALERFVSPDFISDLPTVDEIETDQTRRLQILLAHPSMKKGQD